MRLRADSVKRTYTVDLPREYDDRLSVIYETFKEHAINASQLEAGNKVIVFCCGTGNDFPHILSKIGNEGEILGVDFSPTMLAIAQEKKLREGWNNIDLIEADATEFANTENRYFDAGVCTLGMSIIPDWQTAFHNLLSHVKSGGEVIVGDMQLRTGWRSLLNPRLVRLGREFGGSREGYKNCRKLFSLMEKELLNVRREGLLNDGYCYCVGRKP